MAETYTPDDVACATCGKTLYHNTRVYKTAGKVYCHTLCARGTATILYVSRCVEFWAEVYTASERRAGKYPTWQEAHRAAHKLAAWVQSAFPAARVEVGEFRDRSLSTAGIDNDGPDDRVRAYADARWAEAFDAANASEGGRS